jgi:putative phage-type endonuclease
MEAYRMTGIVHSTREQWLMFRREKVMASECAAILGLDPRRGPLAVYCEKVEGFSVEETRLMRWGRRVEGAIAEGFEEESGRTVVDRGEFVVDVHPDIDFLAATLDRDIVAVSEEHPAPAGTTGDGALECKAVAGVKAKHWKEEPPDNFLVQVQIQMACTGRSWAALCALIGGVSLVWKDVLRHDRFLAAALPKLEEFMLRVKRRDPPPADATDGTTDAIKRLWPDENGQSVELGAAGAKLVEGWERAKADEAEAEKRGKLYSNQIKVLIGEASFGTLPDRTWIHAQKIDVAGRTQVVKPFSYRKLWHKTPKIHTGGR